ncbi:hypothetical protein AB0J80_23405 [Actinoplanes sp. NPDC049548]|uniref:hypothetical protein n=1 Tax=Actinoplanes sp. NPDC049548 TaxID=3155152 RepID=UPI00342C207C
MLRDSRRRVCGLLLATGGLLVPAGCGAPPEPPLTAPPGVTGSAVPSTSGAGYPPVVPTVPTTMPTGVVPPGVLPTATLPTLPYTPPTATTRPATTTPTTVGPSPAPKCTGGPTAAQIIAKVKGTAGIPDRELKVIDGPFCSGTWQFATIEIVARDSEDKYEPLFVVTTGAPATLKLIEAGTDVCSQKVRSDAPAGIRVRACGD